MDRGARGQERREDGSRLLVEVYRYSRGRRWTFPRLSELAEALDWSPDRTFAVASELQDRGWLEGMDTGPSYRLSDEAQDHVEASIATDPDSDLAGVVADLRTDRSRVLEEAYEIAGGSLRESIPTNELVQRLGLELDRVVEALMWLDARALLKAHTMDSALLTTDGLEVVERGNAEPTEAPDPGLAAFGSIHVVNSPGATVTVVQGSPNAVVDVDVEHDTRRIEELLLIVQRSREELPATDARDQAVALLESEAGAGRSSSAAIRRALGQLGGLTRDTTANVLGTLIAKYLSGG